MKKFLLILFIVCANHALYGAAEGPVTESAAARMPFRIGKPNTISLSNVPMVLFDETKSPDKDIAGKIKDFKTLVEGLMLRTEAGEPSFSIDLSRTYLIDEGVCNLLAFLSKEVVSPTGTSRVPLNYLRRLILSNTHITEDSLITLKNVLRQDGFEYLDVTISGASHWEAIQNLYGAIQGTDSTEESMDRAYEACRKVIWLPATFFHSPSTGYKPFPDKFIEPHKTYYGIG